ncbi:MAG TPA: 4a-hydroxytetrahydrobiopterin dehydratase [Vicinamibacterales bacterium]
MAESLADKTCVPCKGGVPPLNAEAIAFLLDQLDGWRVVEVRKLCKNYRFADFAAALAFVNRVGAIAEEQGHHPDIYLAWGKVTLEIWTHKLDGLTESDFVLAAKCDRAIAPSR